MSRSQRGVGGRWLPYLLVLPAIGLLAAFTYFPILRSIPLSLTDASLVRPVTDWLWLDNYRELLGWDRFWRIAYQTLIFTTLSVGGAVLLGVGSAVLLSANIRGRTVFRGLLLIPWAAPPVVITYAWIYLYGPSGVVGEVLSPLPGISPDTGFLSDVDTSFLGLSLPMWSLIQVVSWSAFPLILVFTLAGLSAVPPEYQEAAALDGAGPVVTFFTVTLPLIWPLLSTAVLLVLLSTFGGAGIPLLLTSGGPNDATNVFGVFIYQLSFSDLETGMAAALAVLLFMVTLPLAIAYVRRQRVRPNTARKARR